MPRQVKDARLDTREKRKKLERRREPHWRKLDRGSHLGYRKGAEGGYWVVRRRTEEGRYQFHSLGNADDGARDADGTEILDFYQAQDQARGWLVQQALPVTEQVDDAYTVKAALADYMSWYETHGKGAATHQYSVDAFINPDLGHIELFALTAKQIRDWHKELAEKPPRVRRSNGSSEVRYRDTSDDPDAERKRRASANRVLAVLKAALNHAWHEGKVASDDPWRRVKPFRNVDAPRVRYLTQAECVRLVNTCPHDLRALVQAALSTGCRFGEITALRVSDFNADSGTLLISESKSGKSRHVVLTDKGQKFFASTTAGRPGNETLFRQVNGEPWKKGFQRRPLIAACERAGISPALPFHGLRHTYCSHLVMARIPLEVIAKNLGHSDTRMVEKHYGHMAPSYVADTIRAAAPDLGVIEQSNVAELGRASA